jgi:ATP-dependent Clp protease ATP-binding subunit ClpA
MTPSFDFPFWAVFQTLDNGLTLGEALGFPEVSRLDGDLGRVREQLRRNVRKRVEAAGLPTLHRRHIGGEPAAAEIGLPLDPPRGSASWREPLPLTFPVVRWSHRGEAELAFVPALGIEAVSPTPEGLDERLPVEIRAALSRRREGLTLQSLADLQRAGRLRVERLTVRVRIRSARQRALEEERAKDRTPEVLKQTATDLTREALAPAYCLDELVGRLAERLTARQPRSVLLVGPSGVGKTAAVRELVRRRADLRLGATPFWATSGTRLVAGMTGYGMWQERCRQVVREASRRRAVVHLGNLVELMEVGKSEGNSAGVAAFLRPHLARGDLLAVAECTPEQVPLVEREDPQLLDAFQRLPVSEPTPEQGREVLRLVAENATGPTRAPPAADALDEIDRLHRRYAAYSAQPGRALRFLHNLLRDHRGDGAVRAADVLAAFTRETGLPRVLLDPAAPLDLGRTRRWFAGRVLDQDEAVSLVVDVIAAVKAGLTRPRKPVASLLFTGPTGVGKTETAKALAEFLFGSRSRLTRFDMSEFGDPVSVQRLVGGVLGAEGLLTGRVREQPFCVLLFDEFEKAHPLFLDLLLQVLGEGRLTDAAGRFADFCNAVVILTSNLGAESYQQGAFGFASDASRADRDAARDHFVRAVQAFVRPELFNRIDRVVPFAPLGADAIRRIAARHLERLEARDGIRRRGATLTVGDGVADLLARHGYDVRYGARPLVRAIERELLAPLADQMNRHGAETALTVDVRRDGDALRVTVKPRTDAAGRPMQAGTAAPLLKAATWCVEVRRLYQALERSSCVRELNNDLFVLERDQKRFEEAQRRHARRAARLADAPEEVRRRKLGEPPRVRPADEARMRRLAELRGVADRLRERADGSAALEDEALLALEADAGAEAFTPADLLPTADSLEKDFYDLLLAFYSRRFPDPDALTLALFSEQPDCLLELLTAYAAAAAGWPDARLTAAAYVLPPGGKKAAKEPAAKPGGDEDDEPGRCFWRGNALIEPAGKRRPEREVLHRVLFPTADALVASPPERLIGAALRVRAYAAAPRLAGEQGTHSFLDPKPPLSGAVRVEMSEAGLALYAPPAEVARRGGAAAPDVRRVYDRGRREVTDRRLGRRTAWPSNGLPAVLRELIEAHLRSQLLALLDE